MINSVTHFEIYAEKPAKLVDFYRRLFGWQIDKAPGLDYWRITSNASHASGINGGLTYRPFPGPRCWVLRPRRVARRRRRGGAASWRRGIAPEDRRAEDGLVCGSLRPGRKYLRSLATRPGCISTPGNGLISRRRMSEQSNTRLRAEKPTQAVKQSEMYYTDDSILPENMAPLIITVAPFGPQWLPGDADIPVTWDEQVQTAVDCWNAGATMLHVHVGIPRPGRVQ
jgi:beta-keto acid cleavage enzyme